MESPIDLVETVMANKEALDQLKDIPKLMQMLSNKIYNVASGPGQSTVQPAFVFENVNYEANEGITINPSDLFKAGCQNFEGN